MMEVADVPGLLEDLVACNQSLDVVEKGACGGVGSSGEQWGVVEGRRGRRMGGGAGGGGGGGVEGDGGGWGRRGGRWGRSSVRATCGHPRECGWDQSP